MRRLALAAAFAVLATPASAQVTYNGWDIGPDYGAMLEEEMRKFNQFTQQLAEYERQVTEAAMADPVCKRLYDGHLQGGGRMDFPNFAYLCWATQYFTPQGIAIFQQNERENWKKEYLATVDLRKMEAIRGGAQLDLNKTIGTNLQDLGTVTAGREGFIDPWSAQTVYLPQLSTPNERFWDQQTQRYYSMNEAGTYFVWDGTAWQALQTQPQQEQPFGLGLPQRPFGLGQ